MRDYMRRVRANKPPRICPDCKSRELDKHQHYCSECVAIRKKINDEVAYVDWLKNNPDYHKKYALKKLARQIFAEV